MRKSIKVGLVICGFGILFFSLGVLLEISKKPFATGLDRAYYDLYGIERPVETGVSQSYSYKIEQLSENSFFVTGLIRNRRKGAFDTQEQGYGEAFALAEKEIRQKYNYSIKTVKTPIIYYTGYGAVTRDLFIDIERIELRNTTVNK